jgi:hypothetical protein
MNRLSTLQSRLGQKQDNLRRKLIDNQLRLIGFISDGIRLRARKTFEGDSASWIVSAADVIQVVFPPLNEVPFRKIKKDRDSTSWQLTSLIGAFEDDMQQKAYTLQIPYQFDIDVGDLIFRIFIDEAQQYPIILCLQVTELLGTIGAQKLIMQQCKSVIPTENFPQEIIDAIQQMAERRLKIRY